MSMTEIMDVMRMILGSLLPSVFGQKAGLEMTVMSEARIGEYADQLDHTDLVLIQQELRTLSHIVITKEWTGEHPKRTQMTHGLETQMKVDRLVKASATLDTYAAGCECIDCKFVVAEEMPSLSNVVLGTPVKSFRWTGTGMVEEVITPDPALELEVPITEDEIRHHMEGKLNGAIRPIFVWQHKMNAAELIEDYRKTSFDMAGYEPTYVGGGSDAEHDWVEDNYNLDSGYDKQKNRMADSVVVHEAREREYVAHRYPVEKLEKQDGISVVNSDIVKFIHEMYGQEPLNGDDIDEITQALKKWNGEDDEEPVREMTLENHTYDEQMLYVIIRDSTNASDRVEAAEMLVELKQKQLHSYLKDRLERMPSDLDLNMTVVQEARSKTVYMYKEGDEEAYPIVSKSGAHKTLVQSITHVAHYHGTPIAILVAEGYCEEAFSVPMETPQTGNELLHGNYQTITEHREYQGIMQDVSVQLSKDDERFDHTTVNQNHVWDQRTLTNSDINKLREQWNRELGSLEGSSKFFPYSVTGARAASSLIGRLLTEAEDGEYGGNVVVNVLCANYSTEQVLKSHQLKDEFGGQIMSQAAGYNLPMTDVSLLEMSETQRFMNRGAKNTFISSDGGRWKLSWAITGSYDDMVRESPRIDVEYSYSTDMSIRDLCDHILKRKDDGRLVSPRELKNEKLLEAVSKQDTYLVSDHQVKIVKKDLAELRSAAELSLDDTVVHEVRLDIPDDHWDTLLQTLLLDTETMAIEPSERDKIREALDSVETVNPLFDRGQYHCGYDVMMNPLYQITLDDAIEMLKAGGCVWLANESEDNYGGEDSRHFSYPIEDHIELSAYEEGHREQDFGEELLIVTEPMFYNKHGNLLEGHVIPSMMPKNGLWRVSLTLARDARHRLADETHFDEEHIEGEIKSWLEDIDYRVVECDIIDISSHTTLADLGDTVKNQLMATKTEEEVKEIAILYQTRQAFIDGFIEPPTKEQIDALYVSLPNSTVLDVIEQLQPVSGYHWSKVVGNLDRVSDQIFHIMNHDNRNPLSISFHKHGIDGDRTMQNWMGDNGLGHTSMSVNDVVAYRLTDGWIYHRCMARGWAWLK